MLVNLLFWLANLLLLFWRPSYHQTVICAVVLYCIVLNCILLISLNLHVKTAALNYSTLLCTLKEKTYKARSWFIRLYKLSIISSYYSLFDLYRSNNEMTCCLYALRIRCTYIDVLVSWLMWRSRSSKHTCQLTNVIVIKNGHIVNHTIKYQVLEEDTRIITHIPIPIRKQVCTNAESILSHLCYLGCSTTISAMV